MKVEATQSDFDELCNTLFLNGMIEVADDEPVYRQAQSCSNNWGGSSCGCVSPVPKSVWSHFGLKLGCIVPRGSQVWLQ